jgi:hypothetical protein
MATKEEIRPVYTELQGCLSQVPLVDKCKVMHDAEMWEHVNGIVDELSQLSGEDYSRFRIIPKVSRQSPAHVTMCVYRTQLNRLIMRLYGKYFSDEPSPFGGAPQMVNIQAQQQGQSVYLQMIMEIINQLDLNGARFPEGTPQRTFIDKLKGHLKSAVSSTMSMAQLITTILTIASQCGLTVAVTRDSHLFQLDTT